MKEREELTLNASRSAAGVDLSNYSNLALPRRLLSYLVGDLVVRDAHC